jgi:hypothetical protein
MARRAGSRPDSKWLWSHPENRGQSPQNGGVYHFSPLDSLPPRNVDGIADMPEKRDHPLAIPTAETGNWLTP